MRQMPSLHFAESEVAAGRVAGGLEDGQLVIPVRRTGGRCVCVCVCVRENERQGDKETRRQGHREIGCITSLCVIHLNVRLCEVRFSRTRVAVAYNLFADTDQSL